MGGVYPTVGVHHIAGYVVNNTVNGVSNILFGCHQQAGSYQDHEGGLNPQVKLYFSIEKIASYLVVEAKDVVVDAYFVELQEWLH